MIQDYSKNQIDDNLNSLDSLLNVVESGEKLNFLDGLESSLSEMIEPGVIGAVNKTLGVEVGGDKAGSLSYLQSRNYSGTAGWRLDSNGNITASAGTITGARIQTADPTLGGDAVMLDITGGTYAHKFVAYTSGTAIGQIFGTAATLNIASIGTGNAIMLGNTVDGLGMTIWGTTILSKPIDITGGLRCDTFRIDQTPATETITPNKTFTISLNGVNYKVACVAA